METIYEFCLKNLENINNFHQPGFKWKKRYLNATFKKINGVIELEDLTDEIKRSDVIVFFENQKYYHGFVSALMWGGISTRPSKGHKGDKMTSSAYKVLSLPEETIKVVMRRLKFLIERREYEKAYNLLAIENKFEGMNVSFFTKLLYFMSESIRESIESNSTELDSNIQLLIYDKWTKVLHLLLLLEQGENEKIVKYFGVNYINSFFSTSFELGITNLVYCNSNHAFESYLDYCKKLNGLARELSQHSNVKVSPSNLEAFLFGLSKKFKSNIVSNNREIIRNKIKFYVSKV